MSNWKKCSLGQVVTFASGSSFSEKYQGMKNEEYDFYKVSDMNTCENNKFMITAENTISKEISRKIKAKIHPKNTVIFPKVGAALLTNKRRITTKDSIFDNNIMGLIATEEIDYLFLYYFMSSIDLGKYVQTGAIPSVNNTIVENIMVQLPPMVEQQKIAEILSSVDAAIEKTEQVIAKTEEVKKGLMQQLLTKGIGHTEFKQTEIGEIPLEWNIMKIAEFTNVKTGGTPSKKQQSYWENGNIPWMSSGEIHKKYIRDVDEYITIEGYNNSNVSILPIGSVMMALNGQGKTRGTVAILETETTCNQSLAAILPNDTVNEYFLYHLLDLKYQELRAITGDGARTGLNLSLIRNIIIQVPSMKEQLKIVQIINTIDVKLQSEKKNQRKLEALKTALMQQLLTGQMRVKID